MAGLETSMALSGVANDRSQIGAWKINDPFCFGTSNESVEQLQPNEADAPSKNQNRAMGATI
jgi:predicted ThiF/HesA family dinucleotide-utilizing enzyme